MEHLDSERLQAYLNGAASLPESAEIREHLARCARCADRLGQMAFDDAFLTQSLTLNHEEQAWIDGLDLAGPVRRELAGWIPSRPALVSMLVLLLAAGWLQDQVRALLGQVVAWSGPIGLTVGAVRWLALGLWDLLVYIGSGGLLPLVWPALAAGGALWLLRRRLKGANRYA